ncbi:MAG: lipopolysaccharide biosynthesis protein [Acidimicrobiales bacterium]
MNAAAPPPGRGQALQRGLLERLRGGAGSPIGGRAGWSLVVELLQLASSTLVFLVLVQFMPQETFGELGALLALAFPALSVATLGSHYLLLRRSSQGGDLADAWKRATTVGFVGPILAAGLMIALRPLLLPNVDPWAYALVFIGNLPFYWMNELAVYLGVGTGRMKQAAQARFILVIWRFMALGWFAIWGDGSLVAWASASALSFVASGFGALLLVHRSYGLRPGFERTSFTDLPPGIPFSANSVNESLVDSSDRWLLVRFGHLDDAALYTLGARVVQFGYLPLRTLLRAYDADLFGEGQYGVRATLAVTRRMIKPGMAIAVAVGFGFVVLAPLIPVVAGPEYNDSVNVIRLLSVLPVIRMVQYLAGNILSASDRQPWRMGATGLAMVTNLGLNLWLLRDGTWRTAVFTTFVSEILLAGLLIGIVGFWVRREDRDDQTPDARRESAR